MKVKFKQWNCEAIFGLYENLRMAIQLFDEEDKELVAIATVNLPSLGDESIYSG